MENPYSAPRGQISDPIGLQAPLTWKQIFFSFEGRIPRRSFWGFYILTNVIVFLAVFGIELILGLDGVGKILVFLLYIPLIWVIFAIFVKRWHDRDKPGAWVLLLFIPIVGAIWTLVECGCLRGTEGPNTYGEDPT